MSAPSSAIDLALTDQLLKERGIPELAHLVLLGVVFLLIWEIVPISVFLPWAGAVTIVVGARGLLWHRARRLRSPSRQVRLVARVTMVALGLAWGIGVLTAIPYLPAAKLAVLVMVLAGLLAGGITTLMADRWLFPLYAGAMLGPVLAGVLLARERAEDVTVPLILIFLVFTVRLHKRAHQMLVARLQVEEALRYRQSQLAAAQAIAHVGSWEWDLETNAVTWSDELRRIFGVPSDAPASYPAFVERIHPADRERVIGLVAASAAQRREMDYDWRMLRPDGEERHTHTRNIVITDATGRAKKMVGTCLDITERKRAEENQRTLYRELQASVAEVKVLHGILPICASCKRIKNETGGWEAVESFVRERTDAEFSHGLCPDCAARDWGTAPSTHRP